MSATPTRRRVVKTAVWTVPTVVAVGAIPAYAAASGPHADITAGSSCKHADTYGTSPRGEDIYKYHLTIHFVSTYGTSETFTVTAVTTGSTSAVDYTPNPMTVLSGTSDLVLEAFIDVVAEDPIVVVGNLDGRVYTLMFNDFNACATGTA